MDPTRIDDDKKTETIVFAEDYKEKGSGKEWKKGQHKVTPATAQHFSRRGLAEWKGKKAD